nr:transposase family protein [Actinopolyspora halophila]
MADYLPTLDELATGETFVVDGTLLPCWSWEHSPELYSGKHRTTGLTVQLVSHLDGRRRYVSTPADGKTHDAEALRASGILEHIRPGNLLGDKGYVGLGMLTPHQKTRTPRPPRLGKRIQRANQPHSLRRRTRHR